MKERTFDEFFESWRGGLDVLIGDVMDEKYGDILTRSFQRDLIYDINEQIEHYIYEVFLDEFETLEGTRYNHNTNEMEKFIKGKE